MPAVFLNLEVVIMTEYEFSQAIHNLGGELYIVGGWVRDKIRKVIPKDKDYLICHLEEEVFIQNFPQAIRIGKSFPVYNMKIDNTIVEIAFARTERKTGTGYTGFTSISNSDITLQEDLYRRDTTMNALAYRVLDGQIIDYHNGIRDINNKSIQAISSHFTDDPVRSLRAVRQACEFDFNITPRTIKFMRKTKAEIALEPTERIWKELERVLHTSKPSNFFRLLQKAELLESIFPEIHSLIGQTQPVEFHPEGDAFEHTMQILDDVSAMTTNPITRFAALAHDLGKGLTPRELLPHHYGHEHSGTTVLANWNRRMTIPKQYYRIAEFMIKQHMRAARLKVPKKILQLIIAIHKIGMDIDEFNAIVIADHNELPIYLTHYQELLDAILEINGRDCPQSLTGIQIRHWMEAEQLKALQEKLLQLKFNTTID